MIGFIGSAFVAGLVGSLHCIGMCGPFAVACGGRAGDTVLWHAGRLTTYTVMGVLAGAFGSMIPGPGWVGAVIGGILITWFAASLAGFVAEPHVSIPGVKHLATNLATRTNMAARFGFGMATGLLPCGLVYATLAVPVAVALVAFVRAKAGWRHLAGPAIFLVFVAFMIAVEYLWPVEFRSPVRPGILVPYLVLFFGSILLMGLPMFRMDRKLWLITAVSTVLLLGSMVVAMRAGVG